MWISFREKEDRKSVKSQHIHRDLATHHRHGHLPSHLPDIERSGHDQEISYHANDKKPERDPTQQYDVPEQKEGDELVSNRIQYLSQLCHLIDRKSVV